jgi:hypothetical protein
VRGQDSDTEGKSKWQPVLIMLRGGNGRLECGCGALAVVVIGQLSSDTSQGELESVDYWCQSCYLKEQEGEHDRRTC